MIRSIAERLVEQVEAHEEWVTEHGNTLVETRGEGHTLSEISRTVSIMRDELMQLKRDNR